MAIEVEREGRQCRIAVRDDLVVPGIAGLMPQIMGMLAECDVAEIDLGGVVEIDPAGLQSLLHARREASALGTELRLINHSHTVAALLELCEPGGYLGADPPPEALLSTAS